MSRLRFVTWRRVLGLLVLGALASCVAQEPYKAPPAAAGAAGKSNAGGSSAGIGGLNLTNPDAGASPGGVAGDAGAPAIVDPECLTSAQCAAPYPYCLARAGRCVECLGPRNCIGTGRAYCNGETNECVLCVTDGQCPQATPYCATTLGECVECISSTNCGGGGFACDRSNFHCAPTCGSNADCASSALKPFCDPGTNLCVACIADEQCPAAAPRCESDSKTCVKCLDESDCGSVTPRCDTHKNVCVQCVTNRDCQAGVQCLSGACANPQ